MRVCVCVCVYRKYRRGQLIIVLSCNFRTKTNIVSCMFALPGVHILLFNNCKQLLLLCLCVARMRLIFKKILVNIFLYYFPLLFVFGLTSGPVNNCMTVYMTATGASNLLQKAITHLKIT